MNPSFTLNHTHETESRYPLTYKRLVEVEWRNSAFFKKQSKDGNAPAEQTTDNGYRTARGFSVENQLQK